MASPEDPTDPTYIKSKDTIARAVLERLGVPLVFGYNTYGQLVCHSNVMILNDDIDFVIEEPNSISSIKSNKEEKTLSSHESDSTQKGSHGFKGSYYIDFSFFNKLHL